LREISVAIIGVGPRGLSAFDRIIAAARAFRPPLAIAVHLIDPGESGQGSHSARQADYLLTNTVASQVTMFPLRHAAEPEQGNTGPSFTEWARATHYRRFGDRYQRAQDGGGVEIDDADYLPRSMLGEYLSWFYDRLIRSAPGLLRHFCHRQRAVDMSLLADGRCVVKLENAFDIICDYVFITTGHGENRNNDSTQALHDFATVNASKNPRLAFISGAYPTDRLVKVSPHAVVAIQGLGLTAHDVIAELTAGRGGSFAETGGRLSYQRSGREPKLLVFSRHSLPYAARGINQKGLSGRHHSRFFTKQAIEAVRAAALKTTGSHQLDFEADVLPLLIKEMCFAFRRAARGGEVDWQQFAPTASERAAIDDILYPLHGRRFSHFASFRSYIIERMKADLIEARRGNLTSPGKAATDVIRDVRDSLCEAAEHGGLTPASHRRFVEEFVPLMNRVSFGPPRRRIEEMLALIDAGVLDWASGPSPAIEIDDSGKRFVIQSRFDCEIKRTPADVIVAARLDIFRPAEDRSAFMANLLRRGLCRPYCNGNFHPGGLDIDRNCHPISLTGETLGNVWVNGYPAEGPHFYTHALPRPMRRSRHLLDAERCVGEMVELIRAGQAQRPRSSPQRPLERSRNDASRAAEAKEDALSRAGAGRL